MHCCCYCGNDVDTSDMHGVVAFEVKYEGGLRYAPRPRMIDWAHVRCEEREHGIDLSSARGWDRWGNNYLSGRAREAWLDDAAESAEERRLAMGVSSGGFLDLQTCSQSLKR